MPSSYSPRPGMVRPRALHGVSLLPASFTPKDKLARFLKACVDLLELSVWTKARITDTAWDDQAGAPDADELVFATGVLSMRDQTRLIFGSRLQTEAMKFGGTTKTAKSGPCGRDWVKPPSTRPR